MSDFRAKWGWALGPIWTTTGQTTDSRTPVFAESNTRPDVTLGTLFYTNNTTNTTIVDFNLNTTVRNGNEYEGKVINLYFLDNSTRLANAGNLRLATSDGLQGANNFIALMYHNSGWTEMFRSHNNSDVLLVTSAGLGGSGTTPNLYGIKTIYGVSASTTPVIIRLAPGGEQGQMLNVINAGSTVVIILNSAGPANKFLSTSSTNATQMVMTGSDCCQFIRFGTDWIEVRPAGGALNLT